MLTLNKCHFTNKKVILRVDFNVPMSQGKVTDNQRILAVLPTIRQILDQKPHSVIILSHLGRPQEGVWDPEFSLAPVAHELQNLLKYSVRFEREWLTQLDLHPGDLVLAENVRFLKGETENDPVLSKQIAAHGDIFVLDAFASCHRAHASTVGVMDFISQSCAGLLLESEVNALNKIMLSPARPLVTIIGGAKISTKFALLDRLSELSDTLIVGGGIANTLLFSAGYAVGRSLMEHSQVAAARRLLDRNKVPLPVDVVVTKEISANSVTTIRHIADIQADEIIADIGPETSLLYEKFIQSAKTILWNGPVGVFEYQPFSKGTEQLAHAVAKSPAFSVAGGGDTLAALAKFQLEKQLSYVSTGGGAFLEYIESGNLPAIQALNAIKPNHQA